METQRFEGDVMAQARRGAEWLRTEEVALLIGVSPIVLARWRVEGRGPAFSRPSPRFVRYSRREVERWLADSVARSTSEADARDRAARG